MPIQAYINEIQSKYDGGDAREHTYRPALETLMKAIMPDVTAFNDPARIQIGDDEQGQLDFILRKNNIDIGYIETKDVNDNLNKTEKSEQLQRYLKLPNLILTDYLEFRFYEEGECVAKIRIGDILMEKVQPREENFAELILWLEKFAEFKGQTIKSAADLAGRMARRTGLIKDIFYKTLELNDDNTLITQYEIFKEILLHDMDHKQFADIYAQTLAYGLLIARYYDPTLENFSRAEAQDLIPKSNPFLKRLFHYITGPELDSRIIYIVDEMCQVFVHADVKKILHNYGKSMSRNDPIIHFYETFLSEYDPKLRKSRGVWYTPEPVVNFIVRAIDDVLKMHFNLPEGIADTSKTTMKLTSQTRDDRTKTGFKEYETEIHKVQLLDVATGTGTFLAEAIRQIHESMDGIGGAWQSYVENDLIPRLHGFELMVASYAICHLKLDMLLNKTGYDATNAKAQRLGVYLTNSLEMDHSGEQYKLDLANWLSNEANEANHIKNERPIMVAFGNPPYSGISSNMDSWTATSEQGIEQYKYVDGVHFNERKHWLNDDYVQFIRLGEHYIEQNGEGVLAYITNHSYLDNPTFRGMRWHLLKTFDEIYIVDLHGNSSRGETAPDGSNDVNVFDIQAGVAIIIGIKKKNGNKNELATVYHHDIYGKRNDKYERLFKGTIESIEWTKLNYQDPFYFFIPQNYTDYSQYRNGFPLNELFSVNVTGIVTARDSLVTDQNKEQLEKRIKYFSDTDHDDYKIRQKYFGNKKEGKYLQGDTRGWKLSEARKNIQAFNHHEVIKKITYRPFDDRFIYYTPEMVDWGREEVVSHLIKGDNLALISMRHYAFNVPDYCYSFVSRSMLDNRTFVSNKGICLCYPLYRYETLMGEVEEKVPNLDPKIYAKIKKYIPDLNPENLFDYIYAVLHSPTYRTRYAEFLKSDFPRIPYPNNVDTFHALSKKGAAIRALHLLECDCLNNTGVEYPINGDNEVIKPRFESGKVFINDEQYFDGVSQTAWEFYIGGYQPAQKWLKDRKGRKLSVDDIKHYRKVIKALSETDRLMKEIDEIDFLPESDA